MALIKCPECGKEISDKAESCPNCGCPASEILSKKNDRDTEVLINEFQKAIKESHLMNPNDRKKAQKEIRKYAREKEILVSIADAQTIMKAEYAGKDTRNLIKKQIERTKRGQELDERFFASISETI